MDPRQRLAGVLQQLRELGLSELFLDELTAEKAVKLLSAAGAAPGAGPSGAATPSSSPPVFWGSSRAIHVRRGCSSPTASPVSRSSRSSTSSSGASATGEPGGGEPTGTARRLAVLSNEASGCVKCGLSEGRTQVVFGRGSAAAELVVVGEAPGREEDRTGLPFVGPAGKLLDLLLLSVGIERDSAYICNVLKCRPPNNRDPRPDEVDTCAPYLHAQLDIIQPRVLLAVGKFAAQWLSGAEQSIGRLRGRVHEYRGIPVVATYHPAYLLRSPHATRKTWQDLQLMRQVMDEHA